MRKNNELERGERLSKIAMRLTFAPPAAWQSAARQQIANSSSQTILGLSN